MILRWKLGIYILIVFIVKVFMFGGYGGSNGYFWLLLVFGG